MMQYKIGASIMNFLKQPTRILFFTGKGGVGKTSLACTTAVQLADAGKKVLLVSTDPASNLDEVLNTGLGQTPTPVADVPRLWAMNIDPEAAAHDYRERMVAPYRGVLPDTAVASMEEQFSGSCTLEIAAFDEFARYGIGTALPVFLFAVLFVFGTQRVGAAFNRLTQAEWWVRQATGATILAIGVYLTLHHVWHAV